MGLRHGYVLLPRWNGGREAMKDDLLFSRPPDSISAPEKFYANMTREEKIEATRLVRQIVGNMRRNKIHPEQHLTDHATEKMDDFGIDRGVVRGVVDRGQITKLGQDGVVTLRLSHPQPNRSAEMVIVVLDLNSGHVITVHRTYSNGKTGLHKPPKPFEYHVKKILEPLVDKWKGRNDLHN
jgi:hypothetical protein